MLTEKELYQYQRDAATAIVERRKLALWLDCGLGKTIICLTAITRLKNEIRRVLVVAPKTVAENVWRQEAALWEHTAGLRVSLVIGTARQRITALQEQADIYVIGRDNIRWLASLSDSDNGYLKECSMLILDESTSFKHRSSQRWKALCQKGKRKNVLLKQFERIVLLSGTPASESYEGLWSQIYILDEGKRLDTSITRFRTRYMIPNLIHNRVVFHGFRRGACREIDEKIKDLCIAMKASDYLQLPEKLDIVRYTGYKPGKSYHAMRYDGVLQVSDDVSVMAVDAATRYGKLRQICSGYIYDEDGISHRLNSFKEEAFTDLLEELRYENVLVYYNFQFERDFIVSCGGVPIETADKQADWNAGRIRLAVANPSAVGYGVNIQRGGSVIVWYSLPLSYECYLQAVDRLHRQGQNRTVRVIHLISEGTVEQAIYRLLKEEKADLLNQLMEFHKINNNNNNI